MEILKTLFSLGFVVAPLSILFIAVVCIVDEIRRIWHGGGK